MREQQSTAWDHVGGGDGDFVAIDIGYRSGVDNIFPTRRTKKTDTEHEKKEKKTTMVWERRGM